MEHMFREELHAMFTAHSTDKRSRRFRRSGSLDGNARGEKRIIFSEEEQPAMVPLEQLYVYCCVLLCTVVCYFHSDQSRKTWISRKTHFGGLLIVD